MDGVAEGGEHAEGPQQHHRHGNGRDERGTEVLQEQIHHQKHQQNGFAQGLDHLFDGDAYKGGGVVRQNRLHAGGKKRREFIQLGLYRSSGLDCVGAGGEPHGHTGRRLTVVTGKLVVILVAQFDAGHIAQMDARPAAGGAQQDIAELLRRGQATLYIDRGIELLTRHGGIGAQLTGRYLGILRPYGARHVGGSQSVLAEIVRAQPDTHGILGVEQLDLANTFDPADRVLQTAGQIVAEIAFVHTAVA